jgi:hypothetical protein
MHVILIMVQFVSELEIIGGDQRKVGYYVGLLVGVHWILSHYSPDESPFRNYCSTFHPH